VRTRVNLNSRPDLTREAFRSQPVPAEDRKMYHAPATSRAGLPPDGRLECLGGRAIARSSCAASGIGRVNSKRVYRHSFPAVRVLARSVRAEDRLVAYVVADSDFRKRNCAP
jgi:hypothetical protein